MLDESRIYSKKCILIDGMGAPWIYYECTVMPFWLDSSGRSVTVKRGRWRCVCAGVWGFLQRPRSLRIHPSNEVVAEL